MGEEVALFGKMTYNGLADANNDGSSLIYVSSDLKFLTLTYHLLDEELIDFCAYGAIVQVAGGEADDDADVDDDAAANDDAADNDDAVQNDDDGGRRRRKLGDYAVDDDAYQYQEREDDCPEDGMYSFNVRYELPSTDFVTYAWLSSGWDGTGVVEFRSSEGNSDDSNLLGHCDMKFNTAVTPSEETVGLNIPSAYLTSILAVGFFIASLCCCCVFACCCRRRRAAASDNSASKSLIKHDHETSTIGTKPEFISVHTPVNTVNSEQPTRVTDNVSSPSYLCY